MSKYGVVNTLPNSQLRDGSVPLDTPSLQVAGNEPVPDEIIRDLFRLEWESTAAAPTPVIQVEDDSSQIGSKSKVDWVVVAVENYQEQFNGHRHEFVDVEIPLLVVIRSFHSRQRMWNIMAECRRIIYRWIVALQPYHSLYFDGWQPDYDGPGNYSGVMRIRLTAGAIPVFQRRSTGQESPNFDPINFPDGT